MKDFLITIFEYREYLKQSVARDLRKRYKRSVLGYLWSMLNPLFMMVILTVVFSNIMQSQVKNYSVFLFSAMLPWTYFQLTTVGSLNIIRGNINLIAQAPIPKTLFLLSISFSNLVSYFLSLIPLLLVMLAVGHPLSWSMLAMPLVLLPLFLVSTGLGLIFAVSNTFFEDTQHLVLVLLQALYYLCPILYGREHLPAWLTQWLVLNPMFLVVEFMRDIVYYGHLFDFNVYLLNLTGCLAVLIAGLIVFNWADDKFIYFA